jgi:ribonuclease HII
MKTFPDFKFELSVWASGLHALGIDEAGRGAFAGPLAVGGVVFDSKFANILLEMGINDSKLLSAKKRESLYTEIKKYALFSHVEFVSLEIINEIGVGKATFLGMEKVWKKSLENFINVHCLIDAFKIPSISSQTAIIHGDRLSISIASASILAKVERDKLMSGLALEFPNYGFDAHKGYGTLFHRNALKKFGPSVHHRTQFIRRYI